MKTILVPVDFSDVTLRVVEAAADLAKATEGRIQLLHIVPEQVNYASMGDIPADARPKDSAIDARARYPKELKQINQLATSLQSENIAVDVIFVAGSPINVILEQIEEKPIDLIVMGSHGHGRLYELIVGTVTESVLRRSNKPVLVVPSNEQVKQPRKPTWNASLATPY